MKRTCENCWWHSNEYYDRKQLLTWCDLFGTVENAKANKSFDCQRWTKTKPKNFNVCI